MGGAASYAQMPQAITKIRLISARQATRSEIRFYEENL